MRNIKKHFFAYKLLRPLVYLIAKVILNYKCKPAPDIKEPCLILANHTMDWDPLLVACSFRNPINFLTSEHAMRMGFLSWIIKTFFSPIQRVKGSTDANAALSLVSMIKKGVSVCMFPEGTRSFDGKTGKLHHTTARLIKLCNCTVVTYRLEGGYLTSPRWGKGLRRGKMNGEVVNIYSPEDLRDMSNEQILSNINNDIYINAYESRGNKLIKHRGIKKAEGIERVLYVCPRCHRIGSLKGKGNLVECQCGLNFKYNQYGFLEGMDPPFDTIDGWNKWQISYLRGLLKEDNFEISDGDQYLYTLKKDHSLVLLEKGRLSISKSELIFNDRVFSLDSIKMSVIRKHDIVFGCNGVNYEIHSDYPRSASKYLEVSDSLASVDQQ